MRCRPALFAEALQRASKHIFLIFREDAKISARDARLVSDGLEKAAGSEYERLQLASGATTAGSALRTPKPRRSPPL
jgi:hypothetical protein